MVDTEKTVSTPMERFITEIRDLQAVDHVADLPVIRSKVVMPIFDGSVNRSRQRWLAPLGVRCCWALWPSGHSCHDPWQWQR